MALLSMALHDQDVPAISFTGSQSGIITDTAHTEARIIDVRPIRIGPELDQGKVVIVAGFQGVSEEKEITTLGRGGSDTTAVALAWGLGADLCEILSDVPGVMTADPGRVPESRLLPHLHWDQLLKLARHGAGVMHHGAVEFARERGVAFRVGSSFEDTPGTLVDGIDRPKVTAVTGKLGDANGRVCVVGDVPETAESWARECLESENIGATDWANEPGTLAVTVPPTDFDAAQQALHRTFVETPRGGARLTIRL